MKQKHKQSLNEEGNWHKCFWMRVDRHLKATLFKYVFYKFTLPDKKNPSDVRTFYLKVAIRDKNHKRHRVRNVNGLTNMRYFKLEDINFWKYRCHYLIWNGLLADHEYCILKTSNNLILYKSVESIVQTIQVQMYINQINKEIKKNKEILQNVSLT